MVANAHVYFDESGTHAGSHVLAIGAYWFEADRAERFTEDWAAELKRFELPAAHQTDCAPGNGDYSQMSKERRVEIQSSLIEHVKKWSSFSHVVCVGNTIYKKFLEVHPTQPSAYTFALMTCVQKIESRMNDRKFIGKVTYFFEAGHDDQKEANRWMHSVGVHDEIKSDSAGLRYAGHHFVGKKNALPIQATDMLIWFTRNAIEKRMKGNFKMRKDYISLIRTDDTFSLIDEKYLRQIGYALGLPGELAFQKIPFTNFSLGDVAAARHGLNRTQAALEDDFFSQIRG